MTMPARHRVGRRTVSVGPGTTDLSGNPKPGTAQAVTQAYRAIAFYQRGSDVPVSADYLDRHVNEVTVLVPDRGLWRDGDTMMLGGKASGDNYVGGTAFRVDGDPADWPGGAPVKLPNGIGTAVQVKRVAGAQGVVA